VNICIPVNGDLGVRSAVCGHFGSAPLFMIVDTESGATRVIQIGNRHHGHGMCPPLQSLRGEELDGVVVGGIGMGALRKIMNANLDVYLAEQRTVGETVEAFKNGRLRRVTPELACVGHGHGPEGQ